MFDKSQAAKVITSGILGIEDCELAETYVIDPISDNDTNSLPSDPKEKDSHTEELLTHSVLLMKALAEQQILGTIPDELLPADGKSMAFPTIVIRNAGARWNIIGMSYFVIVTFKKQQIFCLSSLYDVISQDSEEVYQYCTSGMYYL
ncbi:MAG: hypothetical protein EZS28_000638 [Streblomastix strix]|uniref:Uncharacterized protein n=1 Tax=Streblomastix strix TaxID=222440 RepID=A0A5J4XBF5_9EUKA|nr:MAG: hypothetical protein EZS28_000638 [Streblomastix strix]